MLFRTPLFCRARSCFYYHHIVIVSLSVSLFHRTALYRIALHRMSSSVSVCVPHTTLTTLSLPPQRNMSVIPFPFYITPHSCVPCIRTGGRKYAYTRTHTHTNTSRCHFVSLICLRSSRPLTLFSFWTIFTILLLPPCYVLFLGRTLSSIALN